MLLSGLKMYFGGDTNGIQSQNSFLANSSFITVAESDNQRFRIVDFQGKLSIKGRPEININNKWITIK